MKPKILISSCILGNNVRFDGGNKYDSWICQRMGDYFEFVSVCPEVQMGMSIPREPVNLQLTKSGEIKMMGSKSKTDFTSSAVHTSQEIINEKSSEVCGAILQKKSPSCGVERVKLYNEKEEELYTMKKTPQNKGIFASMLMVQKPLLPVIDSGRIFDKHERENFLRRVVCYNRFSKLDGSIKLLQDFHARYKFVIMEHSQDRMRALGKIAANSDVLDHADVYSTYAELLFETLATIPTRKSRMNVFFHLIGFFKHELPSDDKKIIHQMIEDYGAAILPYMVPLKMIEYLINKHHHYYLKNHYILNQFPKELIDD
jgi:uncharacterized protein YbbK (DUF523 family)/uncharacterized protein YbgA (DUF1722 family)